jgi:hypothetical protein
MEVVPSFGSNYFLIHLFLLANFTGEMNSYWLISSNIMKAPFDTLGTFKSGWSRSIFISWEQIANENTRNYIYSASRTAWSSSARRKSHNSNTIKQIRILTKQIKNKIDK